MGLRRWLGLKRADDAAERMDRAPETACVVYEGINLHLAPRKSPVDFKLLGGGDYEPEVTAQIKAALRPGNVAIDVGAHCGHHTASMLRAVGESGTVVAIEPATERFSLLEKSFGSTANVHLVPLGLSSSEGMALLADDPQVSAKIVGEGTPGAGEISLTTLPSIMSRLGIEDVDLLKMDIEGHECEAVIGFEPVISNIKSIIIEIHTKMILDSYGEQKLDRMLAALETYPIVIDMKNGKRLNSVSKKAKSKGRRQFFLSR